jgi:uncharacterized protein HemY
MAKGGKQSGENDWTRAVKSMPQRLGKNVCDVLAMLRAAEAAAGRGDNVKAIDAATKFLGCRHSSYSK